MPRLNPRICLITLVTPFVSQEALSIQTAPDKQEHAYYYFKEPVPLALDAGRIALHHSSDLAATLLALDAEALHAGSVEMHSSPASRWSLLTIPADARVAGGMERAFGLLAAKIDEAGRDTNALFVSPVFLDEYGPLLITSDVLVGFAKDVSADDAKAILSAAVAGEIIAEHFARMHNVYHIRAASRNGFEVLQAANALAQHPRVVFAEPDMLRTGGIASGGPPNDPMFHRQWHLHNSGQNIFDGVNEECCPCTGPCFPACPDMCASAFGTPCQQMPVGVAGFDMGALAAWKVTTGDPSIIIAVFDSGVNRDHPDLLMNPALMMDFTGQGGGGAPVNNTCSPHGTRVAGVIGATMNNGIGIAGLAPDCRIASARIATEPCSGMWSTSSLWIINGLDWAQTIGARITNHSYGLSVSAALTTKFAQTREQGMIHFAAAGNTAGPTVAYPANLPTVNGLSALDHVANGRASYSSYGNGIAFSAPGNVFTLIVPGGPYTGDTCNDYTYSWGTSFASPLAAGVAGLVLSVKPWLTLEEVEQIMRDSAVDLGVPGYDTEYGWGFVNAGGAVQLAVSKGCLADLNCDGVVDVSDLLILLGAWGSCANPSNCSADLNDDGTVDVTDLLILLSNWG